MFTNRNYTHRPFFVGRTATKQEIEHCKQAKIRHIKRKQKRAMINASRRQNRS